MSMSSQPISISALQILLNNYNVRQKWNGLLDTSNKLFESKEENPSGRPSERLIKIAKAADKVTNALYELEKLINGYESEDDELKELESDTDNDGVE